MRACMVAYTFYESDNRVMRYAETLAKRGDLVEVISLRNAGQAVHECVNGVAVYRIQERTRNEKSQWTYLFRILLFFFRSMILLSQRHLACPYDLIHIHSVPDFLVFAAWLPRATGCRLILDIHDLAPELYASKFHSGRQSLLYRVLLMEERWSARFAHHVIIANHLWEKRIVQRSVPAAKCTVVTNAPDPTIFHPGVRKRPDNKFILLFPGRGKSQSPSCPDVRSHQCKRRSHYPSA
jgi:glycosyltransferase involved in cell wall biosynthesis